jgi:hypothetical protein
MNGGELFAEVACAAGMIIVSVWVLWLMQNHARTGGQWRQWETTTRGTGGEEPSDSAGRREQVMSLTHDGSATNR